MSWTLACKVQRPFPSLSFTFPHCSPLPLPWTYPFSPLIPIPISFSRPNRLRVSLPCFPCEIFCKMSFLTLALALLHATHPSLCLMHLHLLTCSYLLHLLFTACSALLCSAKSWGRCNDKATTTYPTAGRPWTLRPCAPWSTTIRWTTEQDENVLIFSIPGSHHTFDPSAGQLLTHLHWFDLIWFVKVFMTAIIFMTRLHSIDRWLSNLYTTLHLAQQQTL